ncbi:MAG TPA: FtsQ-type POTRA domain-containing protein [Acidimicrobiia bacterium]|nr:FtsQ-type POTRA domain-containing protein [Acidimicrobiia bacterium]
MDRRLEKRRREVAEGHARSGLSKLLVVLILASIAGLAIWLFRSPLLAVHRIVVAGAPPHLTEEVRSSSGIAAGEPLISVRPVEVEATLDDNPWISEAEVTLQWPHQVLIEITPRLPVAWLEEGQGWSLVGADAVVLETAAAAGTELPIIRVEAEVAKLGGLAFLAELGPLEFPGALVEQRQGELWAEIGGHLIRLGRPVDMEAKARALHALLAEGIADGASISLVAPTRPAVYLANTQSQVEP